MGEFAIRIHFYDTLYKAWNYKVELQLRKY